MKKKIKKRLLSERGEASYISTFVYILVISVLIAFVINVFHIITVKKEMDHCADQLVKQIQLNGGVNSDTNSLFNFLAAGINKVDNLTYRIDCSGSSNRIQIGTPFYVTVTGKSHLGGIWKFNIVSINLTARGAGVSERYWK